MRPIEYQTPDLTLVPEAWCPAIQQCLGLVRRLRMLAPDQGFEATARALGALLDEGQPAALIERFNLPRMQLIAAAQLDRPQSRARWLSDMLDEMGVPE